LILSTLPPYRGIFRFATHFQDVYIVNRILTAATVALLFCVSSPVLAQGTYHTEGPLVDERMEEHMGIHQVFENIRFENPVYGAVENDGQTWGMF